MASIDNNAGRLDLISLGLIGLIAIAWFGMDTLNVTIAGYVQGTSFYQLLAVTRQPTLLFTGVGSGHGLEDSAFALLCIGALLAALAPQLRRGRHIWFATLAPLLLMLLCFAVLMQGAPALDVPADHSLRNDVLRLTHDVMQRAQQSAASRVSLGAGGLTALISCLALAARGAQRWRAARLINVQRSQAA